MKRASVLGKYCTGFDIRPKCVYYFDDEITKNKVASYPRAPGCYKVIDTIVIQVHSKGNGASFQKVWSQYKDGFGSIEGKNYWIGLDKLHQLTKLGAYGLEVVLTRNPNEEIILKWDSFIVSSEFFKYRLEIEGFGPGTTRLPDAFRYHNGMPFSTKDHDNDNWREGHCSLTHGSTGWWFNACRYLQLNAYIGPWYYWSLYDESKMILKRRNN